MDSIKLGSWIYSLAHADRLSGLERVSLEVHASFLNLLDSKDLLVGVLPDGVSIATGYPAIEEIQKDKLFHRSFAKLEDVDILWVNSINPLGFTDIFAQKQRGLKVVSFLADLLPLRHPEFFNQDFILKFKNYLLILLRISDVLIFISNKEIEEFKKYNFKFNGHIELIRLGASIAGPVLPSRSRSSFALLAVSTIEPRKGYREILEAFDILLAFGYPVSLDIVGRYGWGQEGVKESILSHPELGRNLKWHTKCTDFELTEIYRRTSISILASYDEGWGLALEEGLRHGHKIVARDIPIFRQRENSNTFFFNAENPLVELIVKVIEEPFKSLIDRRTMQDFTADILGIMRNL